MAILTAFIILVSMFILPVNAASVNYSCTSASGQKGDTVTVSVKMSSGVALWGTQVSLSFNSSELQYVSSAKGGLVASGSLNQSGSKITFAGQLNTSSSAKGGTIFTAKFKILKDSGTSTLTVTPSSLAGDHITEDGTSVSVSASNGKVTITKAVTGISLNKSNVTLKKGETATLTATVTPSDATNKAVTYYTSDKYVAKVSSNGTITAVGGGTATITAKAGTKTATCKVTVNVSQTGIAVSGNSSKTVAQGSTLSLKVVKVPSDATDSYSTTWSSADTSIATVSSKGVVTGVALGTTTITAKSNGWTVTYKITVVEPTTESSTEESSTEESSTDESTSTTEPTTEPTTLPTTTEPVTEPQDKVNFFQSIWAEINDENNKVTKLYHYAVMVMVAIIVGAIASAVTFLVTSGYYKAKLKKKDNDTQE